MKKNTFLITACIAGFAAFQPGSLKAQISITQADIATVGQTFNVANDSNASRTINPGASGVNVTWNYPGLIDITTDTIKAVTPGGPFVGLYTGANLEFTYSNFGNVKQTFFENNAGELQLFGLVSFINSNIVPIVYRPNSEVIYPYTLTFEVANSGGYVYRADARIHDSIFDSVRYVSFVNYNDTIDAFGTLTTPMGTKSVLRRREINRSLDSTFVKDTVTMKWVYVPFSRSISVDTGYSWLANGLGYTMLSMQISKGVVTVASWLKGSASGVNEITDKAGSLVYPNPADNVLNIKLASCQNGSVVIMDVTGRQISTTEFSNQLANINTSSLANGLYFYRVTDKTGNYIDAGKFTVVK